VELIEVDALDAEPAQRGLALAPDRLRLQHAARRRHGIGRVPVEAALGEDERPLAGRQLAEQPAHDLLGMSETVHRRGVDPVHARLKRAVNRGNGIVIALLSPGELPAGAADGPGPKAHGRDEQIGISKLFRFHMTKCSRFHDFLVSSMRPFR